MEKQSCEEGIGADIYEAMAAEAASAASVRVDLDGLRHAVAVREAALKGWLDACKGDVEPRLQRGLLDNATEALAFVAAEWLRQHDARG